MKKATTVDVAEYHDEDQRQVMEQIVKDGVCPFCSSHLTKYHREPVLWENDDWLVTKNDYPYEGTSHHLLIICKYHVTKLSKLDPNAWIAFGEASNWIIKHHKIKGGSLLMRFGDIRFNGSSVRHLHAHIIVGQAKSKKTESLKVKVGNKKRG